MVVEEHGRMEHLVNTLELDLQNNDGRTIVQTLWCFFYGQWSLYAAYESHSYTEDSWANEAPEVVKL